VLKLFNFGFKPKHLYVSLIRQHGKCFCLYGIALASDVFANRLMRSPDIFRS